MAKQVTIQTEKMETLLQSQANTTAGLILALAWQAGLNRQEIQMLQWQQVHLSQWQLVLDRRTISLSPELVARLSQQEKATGTVICGNRGGLQPQSISRIAHGALLEGGLEGVRLCDLRHDYICKQLGHRSWGSLSREMDMLEGDLRKAYHKILPTPPPKVGASLVEASAIAKLVKTPSLGALAVGLAFYQGLRPKALLQLRWQSIPEVAELAPLVNSLCPKDTGALVFDMSGVTLSQMAGMTLCSQGLEGVTLRTLALQYHRQQPLKTVELCLKTQPSLTCRQTQALLHCDKSQAYRLLQSWHQAGVLVQVHGHYYSAKQVPAVETHVPLVTSLLQRKGTIYVADVQQLLHLHTKQCQQLLSDMVKDGHLIRFGPRYQLPPT